MSQRSFFYFSLVLSFLLLVSENGYSSCGLQGCPTDFSSGSSPQNPLVVDAALRYVDFDVHGVSGHYTQIEPRIEFRGWPCWTLGGFGSIVALDDGHENHTGLGNPVLFGEYSAAEWNKDRLSFGAQLELALGDDEHGIAAEHEEIVPYASYVKAVQSILWRGSVGYRYALSSDDGHGGGHTPLLVNPHEDKEFLYRLSFEASRASGIYPGLFLDGVHALDGEDKGTGFLTVGGTVRRAISETVALRGLVEAPVTSPHRFEWKIGFHLAGNF